MDFAEIFSVSQDLSSIHFARLSFFCVKLLLCPRMLLRILWSQVEHKIVIYYCDASLQRFCAMSKLISEASSAKVNQNLISKMLSDSKLRATTQKHLLILHNH